MAPVAVNPAAADSVPPTEVLPVTVAPFADSVPPTVALPVKLSVLPVTVLPVTVVPVMVVPVTVVPVIAAGLTEPMLQPSTRASLFAVGHPTLVIRAPPMLAFGPMEIPARISPKLAVALSGIIAGTDAPQEPFLQSATLTTRP